MSFNRPDLKTIKRRIAADQEGQQPGTDARLRRNLLTGVGGSVAAVGHGLHGHLDYNAKQLFPGPDCDEENMLRHASFWLQEPRKAATPAKGTATVSVGNEGAVIPAGTLYQRSDGAEFSVDAEATISIGSASLSLTATVAGTAGNTAADSTFNLVNPIDGVGSSCTVDADGLTGGVELESLASIDNRIRDRVQNPPHGGAAHDYVTWALEVAGVARAWAYPGEMGLGTVTVRFVVDDHATSIIPDAAMVQNVFDYIDNVRPVTAKQLYVVAPIAVPLDFTIQLTPNTATVQAAVQAELEDLIRREAVPENGNGSGTILISHIREAISIAAGETDHALTAPAADVALTTGQITTMGNVTWA